MSFSAYLQSVIANYEKQRDRYVLTDLQVEYREEKGRSLDSPERQPAKQVERLEVLTGLRKYVQKGQVLLVGKPGSGKSTALERLRWELAQAALADETQPIPMLVALRADRPILDAIGAEFRRVGERVKPEEIDEWLLDGRLFLLLDGLNEIPSQEREHQLNQFRQDNPRIPMIFTSRELGTGLGIGQKLEMCGLTERQMRSFVQNYLPDYAELLLRQLKDRLRELAETPLLLKLLCDVFDPVTQQIPQSKGELFQAVDAKYNDWKQREGVRTAEKFWQWNGEILRYLAFVMLQADGTPTGKWLQIERDHAERLLEEFLQDRVTAPGEKAKDWLQELVEHHLLQLTANPNQIEFHHQLFQEYYAAEYLLKQLSNLSDTKLKRDYLNLLKWTEPLVIMLSLVPDAKAVVRIVELAIGIDLVLGARLAGQVKQEFQSQTVGLIQQRIKEENLPEWLKIELLGSTRSIVVVSELIQLLEEKDFDSAQDFDIFHNAQACAWALQKIDSVQSIPKLLTSLKRKNFRIRILAASVLGELGSETAISELFEVLENGSGKAGDSWVYLTFDDAHIEHRAKEDISKHLYGFPSPSGKVTQNFCVRKAVAFALVKIRSVESIPRLLKLLESNNPEIRYFAAFILAGIRLAEAVPSLLKVFANNDDSQIRALAIIVLAKIDSVKAMPLIYMALEDKDLHICLVAITILGEIGSAQSVLKLLKVLECENSLSLRACTAKALGQLGSMLAIPALLRLLEDEKLDVRDSAAWALGKLHAKQALPILIKQLEKQETTDAIVGKSNAIIWALGEIASVEAIPVLLKALEKLSDWVTSSCIANALCKFDSALVSPRLIEFLESENWNTRRISVEMLGCMLPASEALPILLKMLEDNVSYVQQSAVKALGRIGSLQAIPKLRDLLKTSNYFFVLEEVIEALGKLNSVEAIPELLTVFEDGGSTLQEKVAEALGNIEGDRAADILPNLLAIIPTESGKAALQALTAIQTKCQFYNYEIFQSSAELAPPTVIDLHTKIDKIDKRTKQMAEQPSISIGTISGGIQNFTPNQGTQTNTNIGTQNNYFGADDNLKKQIADLNQFIAELEAKHPQIQTETAANDIIDAEIVAVQTNDINRWQTLRQQMLLLKRQFLNPERQLQALKAGLGEAAKHYLEDSVWAKAILTYIDKLSETPDRGA